MFRRILLLFALLRSGQIQLLKASIVGSILISLFFTVGVAVFFGGIRNGMQRFDRHSVGLATTTMILAVVGLLVPTFFTVVDELQQRAPITADFQDKPVDEISEASRRLLESMTARRSRYPGGKRSLPLA